MSSNNFSLTQLQNWMQGMLVHHAPMQDIVLPAAVEDIVNPSQRLSAVHHLDIYRHSYIARLRSCMQSQFNALAYALGPELFELFADQYLDTYPSESYTLNTLGEKFAQFLQETRPDAGREQKENWPDFMIELAGFEYALSIIFDEHADEQPAVILHDTPDEMLKLAPVFHLFHHQYPICSYYLEVIQGREPELPFPEQSYCAVTRHNYKLGLFTIREAQYHFLKNMQRGDSVEAAKDNLVKAFEFKRADLDKIWPEWKKGFIDAGFFVFDEP
ncbi:DNA-binding domain-containing protein [Mucilaginibacter sp.]|uniref:HvfC/BufC N-terminal domain-containing protein n=1 Tax=Mucilaginibacter sp. TaxID=1882438 RepID=UPI0025E77E5B|nr:DNA-binding domain-containing protein [Mucilaginibacter sp.]